MNDSVLMLPETEARREAAPARLPRKPWLDSYPPGVPARIDPAAYASLKELVERSCERFVDKPAFQSMGVAMSYGDLDALSRDFAAYLQNVLGLLPGDRIAIMLPNLLQYPVTLFGALRAGLTVVNINPLYTATELVRPLSDSGAVAIVVLENFAHVVAGVLGDTKLCHVITTEVGDLFPPVRRRLANFVVKRVRKLVPRWRIASATSLRRALAQGARKPLHDPGLCPDDVAFLQYTGGTTGRPKAAILTHANMVANVEQTAAWIGNTLRYGEETIVTPLPLYHVFALTANLLLFVKLGARNVLIPDPRNIRQFVRMLVKVRFSAITGVNTLFRALLDSPDFERVAIANRGRLKVAVAGGMAAQRSVAERWQTATGVPLIEGYGLTEASPIVCANPVAGSCFTGMLGLPLPSTDVSIRNEAGEEVAMGEAGEICVRGPQVMRGYWHAPEETANVFLSDGWLRTGDLGRMHRNGYVEFVERRKDLIVVSGFKVLPGEVEDAAMLHPAVSDAGVVGVNDEETGEAVALFVVRRNDTVSEQEIREHCAKHLTRYKLPKHIRFIDALPKTPIGKVLRRALREPPYFEPSKV